MTRPGRGSRAFVAVAALAVGVAAGRFVTYEPASMGSAGSTAAAVSATGGGTATLEQAVRADPADVGSWRALAAAYVRSAIETGDPSFYDLADRAVREATVLARNDGDTALVAGQLALTRHQFEDARSFGRRASAANPRSAGALLVVVDAEVELGRYDEAAATLQRVLDLRPGLAALSRASYQRELRGDLAGALLAMQQAQTAGAGAAFDRATVTAMVGDLHLRSGNIEAAEAAYEQALQTSPRMVAARTDLARALAAAGRLGEAIALLEGVVEAYPAAAPAQLLGDLRTAAGEVGAAEQAYELVRAGARLQEAAGGVVDLEMALFEADHGDPGVALERALRVHRARPTVYAADAVAWSLYRSGRAAEAVPYAREALRLGTADPALRLHAAAVFAEAGDAAGGAAELRRAFAGQPWFVPPDGELVIGLAARLGVDMPPSWAAWARGATS